MKGSFCIEIECVQAVSRSQHERIACSSVQNRTMPFLYLRSGIEALQSKCERFEIGMLLCCISKIIHTCSVTILKGLDLPKKHRLSIFSPQDQERYSNRWWVGAAV